MITYMIIYIIGFIFSYLYGRYLVKKAKKYYSKSHRVVILFLSAFSVISLIGFFIIWVHGEYWSDDEASW